MALSSGIRTRHLNVASARDVLSGMAHLVKAAREAAAVPVYHWGDIDAGGIRIAAHLEDAFGIPIVLHEMRTELAVKLGTALQSRQGLDRLAERAGPIGELARWLCTNRAKGARTGRARSKSPQ